MDPLDRIEAKLDKLIEQVACLRAQDFGGLEQRVTSIERSLWKAMGALAVLAVLGQVAVQVLT